MVEAHVASSTIGLLPALAFGGSTVAPYILGKSQISIQSSGATLYGAGSAGSRVARFTVSASAGAMLDLSSLTISARVHNLAAPEINGNTKVQFLSPSLSGLIESARITIGGVEVSSCDYLARTEHVMSIMQTDDVRRADFASGFGLETVAGGHPHGQYSSRPILGGESRDVVFRPRCLGILDMASYLPVSMVPSGQLTLEITWVSDPKSCCNTSTNHTSNWNVSNLVVNVDVLSIDPTFLTSISQHIFSGNSFQMKYQNFHSSFHTLLSSAIQLTHSRAASRLNSVLVTLAKPDTPIAKR